VQILLLVLDHSVTKAESVTLDAIAPKITCVSQNLKEKLVATQSLLRQRKAERLYNLFFLYLVTPTRILLYYIHVFFLTIYIPSNQIKNEIRDTFVYKVQMRKKMLMINDSSKVRT